MITYIICFLLYSLFIFIFKKYNITGWKGRVYALVMTLLLMLATIPILRMIGEKNYSEQIAATGTLDNRYFSITVPTGYKGEIMKQYEQHLLNGLTIDEIQDLRETKELLK